MGFLYIAIVDLLNSNIMINITKGNFKPKKKKLCRFILQ